MQFSVKPCLRRAFLVGMLLTPLVASSAFDECRGYFPSGVVPVVESKTRLRDICFDSFAVLYSGVSKTPVFAVEKLSRARLEAAKEETRTNRFYEEARLPARERAWLSDYSGSGYDRGHLAPAADMPNANAMAQSFSLANMVPQDPRLNRGAWSRIESDVRKFVRRSRGDVFVFTGPIFDTGYSTIGENNVWVPTRLFKLVYDESSGRAWAYILPNAESQVLKPVDYARFVRETGLRLLDGVPVTGSVGR